MTVSEGTSTLMKAWTKEENRAAKKPPENEGREEAVIAPAVIAGKLDMFQGGTGWTIYRVSKTAAAAPIETQDNPCVMGMKVKLP